MSEKRDTTEYNKYSDKMQKRRLSRINIIINKPQPKPNNKRTAIKRIEAKFAKTFTILAETRLLAKELETMTKKYIGTEQMAISAKAIAQFKNIYIENSGEGMLWYMLSLWLR